jgi:nitroreductase
MNTFECIATKLDVRQYSDKPVPDELKLKILEAGRLTGSASNRQHWRFILVQDRDLIQKLAEDSPTGIWVAGANFALIVLNVPQPNFGKLDAGRAIQDMQLAAWEEGVVSCIFTGINEEALRKDFEIPDDFEIGVGCGFGYPAFRVTGRKKSRAPLEEIAFLNKFGGPLQLGDSS